MSLCGIKSKDKALWHFEVDPVLNIKNSLDLCEPATLMDSSIFEKIECNQL